MRHALHTRNVLLFCAGMGVLFLSFLLIQFHCRDCGSTGWYLHAHRHACAAVVARWRQDALPRFSLTARTQLLIWSYALASGASRVRVVPALAALRPGEAWLGLVFLFRC